MFISLLFHRIGNNQGSDLIEVSTESFQRYLKIIKDNQVCVKNPESLYSSSADNSPERIISITFDDGWESDYKIAFPLLRQYGFTATFFIVTGWIGKKGFVTKTWIQDMYQHGMEIGSHTVSHQYLNRLSSKEVYEEFYNSRCRLEDILGKEVLSVSIPEGEYNDEVIKQAMKAGYKIVATSKPGINKIASGIISRISIHARTTVRDFERLATFSTLYINKLGTLYSTRGFLKKTIGIENYVKFRDWLFSNTK